MMKRLILLGAGAVGYVFGAKAGHERYEQISKSAQKLRTHPTVQKSVDEAKTAASTAADKVRGHGDTSGTSGTSSTSGTVDTEPDLSLTTPLPPTSSGTFTPGGTSTTSTAAGVSQVPGPSDTGFGRGDETS